MTYDRDIATPLQGFITFGLGCLSNRATIKQIPLLINLAIHGNSSHTVVAIVDCTSHIFDEEENSAAYIIEQFRVKIDKVDPCSTVTVFL